MGNVFSDCVGIDDSKPAIDSGFQVNSTEDEASHSALEDASHLRSTSSMFTDELENGDDDHDNSSSQEDDDDDEDDDETETETEGERSMPHAISSKSVPSTPWDDILDLSNQFYFDSSTDTSPWTTIGNDEDYRAFLLLIHPTNGLLLLHCTRKKNKPPHYQLPGGHVDEEDFEMHEQNLFMAAQAGAARELWEETGIDLRFTPAINRLLPLILNPIQPSKVKRKRTGSTDPLPNEFKGRLFFVASVTDDDFPNKSHQSKRLTRSRNHDIPLFLHLSVEHSGFWFERDPEKAIQLLQLHSGGKVSKALAMAMKTATGDPVLEITPSAISEASDARRNSRWTPKGTTHSASPDQKPPVTTAVSPIQTPLSVSPKVQQTPPASPEQVLSPVRITVAQRGSDDEQFIPVSTPKPPTPVQSKMASPQQSPIRTTSSPPSSPTHVATKLSTSRSQPSERTRSTGSPSVSRHTHDSIYDNNIDMVPPRETSTTMSWGGGQVDETLLRPNPSAQRILDVTVDSFVDSIQEHDQAIEDMLMEDFGSSGDQEEESVDNRIPILEKQHEQQRYLDVGSRAAAAASPEDDEPPFILRAKTDEDAVRQASDNLWAEEEALLKADLQNARQVAQKYSQKSDEEQASLDSPRMSAQVRMNEKALQKAEQEALIRAAQLEEHARAEAAIRQKEKEEEEERIKTSLVDEKIRSEIAARQKAEEARADEKARREAAARQKAQEEARIQAMQMEQAQKEEAARRKAEEEARIKARQLEENARREAEARQKAEEEARIKALQMEEKARKEAEELARKETEALQKAEQEARNKVTPQRVKRDSKWHLSPSPQENRKAQVTSRPPPVMTDSPDEEEEVAQDILNEFTKQVNYKDGSYMSSPRQSRQWDRPVSISKQQPQSPAQTPLYRERRQASWTMDSGPATPKSPTQIPEKELLTAPYSHIAKNKREKEELERQQAKDAFNKAQQAKEAERLQKIQRLEEERKRMRKEEQQKASEEASQSVAAAETLCSSGGTPSTKVIETETTESCDRFILLISGMSGNPLQKVNQGRVVAMLQGKNLAYIAVDGANPAEVDRRNQLFNISGIRGKYPQLFLEQQGQTTFVGDYDTIDDLNETGSLAKLLSQQRDNPSSSGTAADDVAPTSSNEDELSVVNGKMMVMLLSRVSGNYTQKANQERALVMLASNKIRPEIVDASDPSTVSFRNRLFGISGIRGNYPQFFLKNVETGEYSYIGNFNTIEGFNDQGPLEELFH